MTDSSTDPAGGERADRVRRVTRTVVVVAIVIAVAYGVRLAWLTMMATEGDVPPASTLSLPAGAEIVDETRECASGGCSVDLEVRPPLGQSPADLASELGLTPQRRIPGGLLDPRTVSVWGEANGGVLSVRLDYWSPVWVP